MSSILRLKRRATGGAAGAPSSLKTTEPAFNEVDETLYLGFGDDGGGNATSIVAVGGKGSFVDKSSTQTISGAKTFSTSPLAPTPSASDNSTKVATTAYVDNAIGASGGTKAANTVYAGPTTGADAAPTFRSLVANDIPSLTASKISDFNSAADARISAQKGANNGLATLDSTGLVPSSQLPSYVDDVLEFANLAAFPGTGASGVIYVAADTSRSYRWTGSVYTEIVASPGSTDSVSEGSTNLYFTTARVLATVLSGLSLVTSTAITSADTILSAIGKLQAQVTLRLIASNNLSDLASASTARTNLGLGTMATQNASAVAITGGTIDGITIIGGTF